MGRCISNQYWPHIGIGWKLWLENLMGFFSPLREIINCVQWESEVQTCAIFTGSRSRLAVNWYCFWLDDISIDIQLTRSICFSPLSKFSHFSSYIIRLFVSYLLFFFNHHYHRRQRLIPFYITLKRRVEIRVAFISSCHSNNISIHECNTLASSVTIFNHHMISERWRKYQREWRKTKISYYFFKCFLLSVETGVIAMYKLLRKQQNR